MAMNNNRQCFIFHPIKGQTQYFHSAMKHQKAVAALTLQVG